MKNRTLIDIIGALLLYGIVLTLVWLAGDQIDAVILATGLDGGAYQNLIGDFQVDASWVLGISLTCFLLWYGLGAAVIRPHAGASTWYITWFALLLVILATAGYFVYFEQTSWAKYVLAGSTELGFEPNNVAIFYFASGVLLFYIASVFFSPLHAKYRIWPAKYVRS